MLQIASVLSGDVFKQVCSEMRGKMGLLKIKTIVLTSEHQRGFFDRFSSQYSLLLNMYKNHNTHFKMVCLRSDQW